MRPIVQTSSASGMKIVLALLLCSSLGFFPACTEESKTVDAPAPEVTAEITSPGAGSSHVEGDDITFAGSGTDPQGVALTEMSLVWTTDQGGDPLGYGETFIETMPVGDHTITLAATDGDDRTGSDSVDISVAPAVTATITSPAPGSSFDENILVHLSGTAEDYLGDPLTGDSLVWRTSVSGIPLGTGESVNTTLPEGPQTIRLVATDALGRSAMATVDITVTGDGVQFDLTGTWAFTATAPVVIGDYFTETEPMTGFCEIIQTGATITMRFTDGYLTCDPLWVCVFDGSGVSVTYNLSNSGQGDIAGETLTNAITLIASTPTMIEGSQQSVYQYIDGVTTSSLWIHSLSFTKVE